MGYSTDQPARCAQYASRARNSCIGRYKSLLALSILSQFILSSHPFGLAKSAVASEQLADQLITQGHQYLNQGQPSEAYQTWEEALKLYRAENNQKGVMGTLVNQSLAQQDMGQHYNACWSLTIAIEMDAELCRSEFNQSIATRLTQRLEQLDTSPLTLSALQNLGITSRKMWKLSQAQQILEVALQKAQTNGDPALISAINLELANTIQAQWRSLQERFRLTKDDETVSDILRESYRTGHQGFRELRRLFESDRTLSTQAKINWLQFYRRLAGWITTDGHYPALVKLKNEVQPQLQQIVAELKSADLQGFSTIERTYARLKIAQNIYGLSQHGPVPGLNTSSTQLAVKLGQTSLSEAQVLKNDRAKAQALILLGQVYKDTGQYSAAFNSLNRAYNLGVSNFMPDVAYKGSWQLALLNQTTGNRAGALKGYENAIAALEDVRGNLLSVNQALQFSFREEVEPAYQQYLELLSTAPKPDYEKILAVTSQLQLVTLENYLQCGKLAFIPLKDQPDIPALFTLLDVGDQIEVLVRSQGTLHRYSADKQTVAFNASQLLKTVQRPEFKEIPSFSFLPYAQALYSALIKPGEALIGPDQRLIIVTNGLLNNIPPGLLHDGQQYLVQKYAAATSLGSIVDSPRQPRKAKVLFAGVSELSPLASTQGLTSLPEVEQEHTNMAQIGYAQTTLLNQKFTLEKLQTKLTNHRYSILHMATHGVYSSNAADTFLLSWRDRIGVTQLEQLIRQRTRNLSGLDLLFLSACESAKGDSRSQLGLAGLATQAGARNAIATLWRVDSESTAVLASEFYQQLAEGQPYAQALRNAQLKLMRSDNYHHPYHWAPFLLLGGL